MHSAGETKTSQRRRFRRLCIVIAGIGLAILIAWAARIIPLDTPPAARLPVAFGLMTGIWLIAGAYRKLLSNTMAKIQDRRARIPVWLPVIFVLIYVVAGVVLMQQTRWIRQDEVTGDEPEYIMLCRSFLDEGDFMLEVDQATGVCSEFMSGRFQLRGKSVRPPGLPLLLAPAYLAGRHLPWPGLPHALFLWMGLFYVWLSAELFLLIRHATGRDRLAFIITLAALALPPLAPYAFQVYPELPAAVLVLRLFRREFFGDPRRNRLSDGLALALIPVFHQKYMALFVMSGLHLLTGVIIHRRRHIGTWAALLLPSAASLATLSLFFGHRFGIWLPTAPYSVNDSLLANLFTWNTLKVVTGQFLDRKWGLFMICPFLLFAVPGAAALWERRRWAGAWWFATCSGFIVLLSAYPLWWGGFSPPGRFLIPVVPLLWFAVACYGAHAAARRSPVVILGVTLLLISLLFSGLMTFGSPFEYQICSPYLYPEESPNGSALWAAVSTCLDWNQILPAMERGGRWNHILPDDLRFNRLDAWKTLLFVLLVAAVSVELRRSKGRNSRIFKRRFAISSVAAVLCLTLIVTLHLLCFYDDDSLIIRQRCQRMLSRSRAAPEMARPLISGYLVRAYGNSSGQWSHAPAPKHGIFYPPIYIQDMPDTLWPGGWVYTFQIPVRWDKTADDGAIVFSVENRLSRQKQEHRTEWHTAADTETLEVSLSIPESQQGLFKIMLYGDNTSAYQYQPVRVSVKPIIDNSFVE